MKHLAFALVAVLGITMFTAMQPASASAEYISYRVPNGCGGYDYHTAYYDPETGMNWDTIDMSTCSG
jgi:hypothetical protein